MFLKGRQVSSFGCFVFEFWLLPFRDLGASFSSFRYRTSDRLAQSNSGEGDFHNPLTSRCETFDGPKLIVSYPLVF